MPSLSDILSSLSDPFSALTAPLPGEESEALAQLLAFWADPAVGLPLAEDLNLDELRLLQEQLQAVMDQLRDVAALAGTNKDITVDDLLETIDPEIWPEDYVDAMVEFVQFGDDVTAAILAFADLTEPEKLQAMVTDWVRQVLSGGETTPQPLTRGTGADDVLAGRSGDDQLSGMGGNDEIYGFQGNDVLRGGNGNDLLLGAAGDDQLIGQNGADELRGAAGDDALNGGNGDDLLLGGGGNDRLVGMAGNDDLRGGSGDDLLLGGEGQDSMRGNSGADEFRFLSTSESTAEAGFDRIYGFVSGEDRINLAALADDWTFVSNGALTGDGASVATREANGNTLVNVDADGDGSFDMKILVVKSLGLTEEDFIL
ncbi:calcium-binding protein [Marinibacterium profundimaris]|uniref:calcium-binding protein n=1 Tax=Marinibacterium profundimaris TaxID=1679460 RepID=UPI000B526304|nr:hypothetical protein [Marinibacterium profundimaris]